MNLKFNFDDEIYTRGFAHAHYLLNYSRLIKIAGIVGGIWDKMVSYSPVKLVVEEQVPFTPPKLCQTLSQQSLESYTRSHREEDETTSQSLLLDTSLSSSASDTHQKPKEVSLHFNLQSLYHYY